MANTPKLVLPYIALNQVSKYITHNESLDRLDAAVQLTIVDRDLSTPPATPASGATYIVKAVGANAWLGHDNDLAIYISSQWKFLDPAEGWFGYLQDENVFVYWDGAAWTVLPGTVSNFTDLGDVPGSYVGEAGKAVIVKGTEDGLEFGTASVVGDFTDLADVPGSYVGEAGSYVRVKGAEDGLEFTAGSIADFLDLTDTPASYLGEGTKLLAVKSTQDGIEFVTQAGGLLLINRGALVHLESDPLVSTMVETDVAWEVASYDSDACWSAADPTKLTVPADISKVYVVGQSQWEPWPIGHRRLRILRNGMPVAGIPAATLNSYSPYITDDHVLNIVSAPLDVVPGDYFTMEVYQDVGTDWPLVGSVETWFALVLVSGGNLSDLAITGAQPGEIPVVNSAGDALIFPGRLLAIGPAELTDAKTDLFTIALPAGTMAGGKLFATVIASDGTEHQALSIEGTWAAYNKAGTITCTMNQSPAAEQDARSSGTLTALLDIDDTTNTATVSITPTGSLTETTYQVYATILNNSPQAITIL